MSLTKTVALATKGFIKPILNIRDIRELSLCLDNLGLNDKMDRQNTGHVFKRLGNYEGLFKMPCYGHNQY